MMNTADRILLDGLRLAADVSDDVWTLVEAEVAKAGSVLAVGGQARVEIERAVAKARTLIEKHGSHDQSSHGGKKGGGAGASPSDQPSSGGGGSRLTASDKAAMEVSQAGTQASERMVEHANKMSESIYGGKSYVGIDSIDEVELMGISDTLTSAAQNVTMLSASRKQSFKEIGDIRQQLNEADFAARTIQNKSAQRAARRAIRLSQDELTAVQTVHREAWAQVGGDVGRSNPA
jgi:hypothetical protein